LKAHKLTKMTESGKLFHTFTTQHEQKLIPTLLLVGLYNACPPVVDTAANSEYNQQSRVQNSLVTVNEVEM